MERFKLLTIFPECLCVWRVQLSVERLSNDVKLLHILENYARKPIYNNIYINLVSFTAYSLVTLLDNSS